ncbi:hypothetical protein [Paraburkholderia bannensis]|uniref:hypothetical protein n=1 Tax=Paraburkholderia bannensis TaxID=765414 RepID=UPI002ABE3C24|nr:hypothetical protein [Paraburkholderia bannensis]
MKAPTSLIAAAEKAILECRNAASPVRGSGEVAEVARLVVSLPENLVNEWAPHLSAGRLEITGVFTHQTPKALWTDPRTGDDQSPELADLLVIVESNDAWGSTQRALLVQAKVADARRTDGRFTLAKKGPAVQRYLYAHWPPFKLTGLTAHSRQFNIAPRVAGTCPGSRYASINVNTPAPDSGWWVEAAQPAIPTKPGPASPGASSTATARVPADPRDPVSVVDYDGSFDATVSLGEALREMILGTLGTPLDKDPEWKGVVDHLIAVATQRDVAGMKMPGVFATSAGVKLEHIVTANRVMKFAPTYVGPYLLLNEDTVVHHSGNVGSWPPGRDGTFEPFIEAWPGGFGIIHMRLSSAEWKDGEASDERPIG